MLYYVIKFVFHVLVHFFFFFPFLNDQTAFSFLIWKILLKHYVINLRRMVGKENGGQRCVHSSRRNGSMKREKGFEILETGQEDEVCGLSFGLDPVRVIQNQVKLCDGSESHLPAELKDSQRPKTRYPI